MKNIGSERIPEEEIAVSDVFCGATGNFDHLSYTDGAPANGEWTYDFGAQYDLNENFYWDPGETIKITAVTNLIPSSGNIVHFQFILPNGVWRTNEFTVS
jgi:hypothetical protein